MFILTALLYLVHLSLSWCVVMCWQNGNVGIFYECPVFALGIHPLLRINVAPKSFSSLPQLMDVVRSNYEAMIDRHHGGPNFMMHSGISQASEYDDPPGLREKAEYLLREWVNLYHSAAAGRDSTKAFSAFVGQVRAV